MEKRFIIFIVISFLILVGWQLIITKFYPEKPAVTTQPETATNQVLPATPTPAATPAVSNAGDQKPASDNPTAPATADNQPAPSANPPKVITVETPFWRAVFDNQGAVMKSLAVTHLPPPTNREIRASDYGPLELVSQEGLEKVGAPLRLQIDQQPDLSKKLNSSYYAVEAEGAVDNKLTLQTGDQKDLVFKYQDSNGLEVEKRLHLYGNQYIFDLTVKAQQNGQPLPASMLIGPNFGDQSAKQTDAYVNTPVQLIVNHANDKMTFLTANDLSHRNAPPDAERPFNEEVNWIAAADHYFTMAIVPAAHLPKATLRNDFYKEGDTYKSLISMEIPVLNGQPYKFFIGPKDRSLLESVSQNKDLLNGRADLGEVINYGFFSMIIKPLVPILEIVLKSFYSLTNNYGWSIILVTLIINLLFFPLKWKSSVAMKKAAKMQPKMKELQEKMKKLKKDDPRVQELQLEQMKLMKEGNPLSGCLPLFLQMPIFWAIYVFLTISVDVRHSPFIFWVQDLAAPDKTWVLPIIMTISMMASTALTPTPADPSQKMQKVMTSYIMPIIFLLLFFSKAPSGLVLYWMFSNIIGVIMQLIINKMTVEPTDQKKADDNNAEMSPKPARS